MRLIYIFLLLMGSLAQVHAQLVQTAADSQIIHNHIKFPSANASMVISFTAEMMDLSEIPSPIEDRKSVEELLKLYNNGHDDDLEVMMQLYHAYYDAGEPNVGYKYLQKAYNLAIELYDMNPSNLELLEQITEMMTIVGRLQDVPLMWKGYCERNPSVARGWARLAFYETQMLRLEDAQEHIKTAYRLDPQTPEIYVSALLHSIFNYLVNSQLDPERHQDSSDLQLSMDLSFLRKAAIEQPDLELAQMSIQLAELLSVFYQVLLKNAKQFQRERSFQLRLSDLEKVQLADIEQYMLAALKKEEVVNKFMPLKALVVLQVLQNKPDMAVAYLEEAEKYFAGDVDLYKLVAYGYLPPRKYHKAIPFLLKATQLSPTFDDLFALARLYFDNYEYQEALQTLQRLMQSDPDRFEIVYGVISVYLRQGNYSEAQATLEQLERLYEGEVDWNKDEYYPFYKAVCMLCTGKNTSRAAIKRQLQGIVELNLPWKEEAMALIKAFF